MIFRSELARLILRGEKTATRRAVVFDNPRAMWRIEQPWRYPVGKVFAVQPGRGADRVADARVTHRTLALLGHVLPRDARREGFGTRDEFVAAWRAINGAWRPYEKVHVVEFEVVTPACSVCGGAGQRSLRYGAKLVPTSCVHCLATGLTLNAAARALLEQPDST
jgi:hypothetical protein